MRVPPKWRLNKIRLGAERPPNRGGGKYKPFSLKEYEAEKLARK